MVRFQNPNGVEEIRGTGRPSWQLYQGAGQTEAYPAAVQNWHSGLVKESAEAARAKLAADTQLEIAKTPAREGEGVAAKRREESYVFEEAKKKAMEEIKLAKQKEDVSEFNRQLHASSYADFTPGKGTEFAPKTHEMALDKNAAENHAREFGWKAGMQHLDERQLARKYLATQQMRPNTNINAVLDEAASNPKAWSDLVTLSKKAGNVPGQVQPPQGIFGRIFNPRVAEPIRGADVVGP
ncbi:hypothetical protein DFAR_3060002 [Desulfarculales bacterium]